MMKIAHLIDTLSWGGAQKLLVTFAQQARQRNLHMVVICLQTDLDSNPIVQELNSLGVSVIFVSIYRLYQANAIPTLVKLLRAEQINILQTHLTHANTLGAIAGMLAGIPVVTTIHNTDQNKLGHYRARAVVEQMAIAISKSSIIAVGDKVAGTLSGRFRSNRIFVVPNAVTPGINQSGLDRNRLRRDLMGSNDDLLVIVIGRLTAQKAYPNLLTAFSEVLPKFPKAFLAIVGEGKLYSVLQKQMNSLGIEDRVSFLGAREDVPDLLAAADIYVSASHWEGLSVAMLEAMAAGLPVLATEVGDAPALLNNGRGILIPPNNVTALAHELENLLASKEKRQTIGAAAKKHVETQFSPESWLDKILAIYRQSGLVEGVQQ